MAVEAKAETENSFGVVAQCQPAFDARSSSLKTVESVALNHDAFGIGRLMPPHSRNAAPEFRKLLGVLLQNTIDLVALVH